MDKEPEDFPVVLKNKITNWKMLHFTKEDWCGVFGDKILKFREGCKTYTETPYWERLCTTKEMTLNDFFELSSKDSDRWLYFDYKYVKDVFPLNKTFVDELKWADVGLSDFHGEESALWIGNTGAHTPCHRDTYGCNLVAQLFGRKMWILLPPEEMSNLHPVRVPYEESSIYSNLNFYTPTQRLSNIKQSYRVVLSPGDVLYVPRHWWHYVENLEPAISINIWIPMDEDDETRVEESLVRHFVSNICMDLTRDEMREILNPNEVDLPFEPVSLDLIVRCLESYNESKKNSKRKIQIEGEAVKVEKFSMESYLEEKSKMILSHSSIGDCFKRKILIAQSLINSYCHPLNIESVKKTLLTSFQ